MRLQENTSSKQAEMTSEELSKPELYVEEKVSNLYSTSVPFCKAKRMCREPGVILTKEDRQYVVKELRGPHGNG